MPPDVCFNDLKFIIEFVYRGEIDVSQAELQVGLLVKKERLVELTELLSIHRHRGSLMGRALY